MEIEMFVSLQVRLFESDGFMLFCHPVICWFGSLWSWNFSSPVWWRSCNSTAYTSRGSSPVEVSLSLRLPICLDERHNQLSEIFIGNYICAGEWAVSLPQSNRSLFTEVLWVFCLAEIDSRSRSPQKILLYLLVIPLLCIFLILVLKYYLCNDYELE